MTITRSATSAITPRSWVIMITAIPSSLRSRSIRRRICACVVTSSAVVGSSAISSFGSFVSAIAIITRCRMPPENSCGYSPIRRSASGIPTSSSRSMAWARAAPSSMSWWIWIASTSCLPIL